MTLGEAIKARFDELIKEYNVNIEPYEVDELITVKEISEFCFNAGIELIDFFNSDMFHREF